jgi:hypothetical protein
MAAGERRVAGREALRHYFGTWPADRLSRRLMTNILVTVTAPGVLQQSVRPIPLFDHFGVPPWVPEVGGPIDPANEAHDLVMSVFGGMSKGERNRIKIRVRSAMAAQAAVEGRFLGGRPPYGYLIADAGRTRTPPRPRTASGCTS